MSDKKTIQTKRKRVGYTVDREAMIVTWKMYERVGNDSTRSTGFDSLAGERLIEHSFTCGTHRLIKGRAREASKELTACGPLSMIADNPWARVVEWEPLWGETTYGELVQIAKRWHLNGLRAGTFEQCEYFSELIALAGGNSGDVDLDEVTNGVVVNDPRTGSAYRFGSEWLFEIAPDEVRERLEALPW